MFHLSNFKFAHILCSVGENTERTCSLVQTLSTHTWCDNTNAQNINNSITHQVYIRLFTNIHRKNVFPCANFKYAHMVRQHERTK